MTEKRTKIITTIGPASDSKEVMSALIDAGMTTVRLNFSHGDEQEQGARITMARELSKEKNLPISVLLDTKGPEIRVGKFADKSIKVNAGDVVTIHSNDGDFGSKVCGAGEFTVSYDMSKDLEVGKIVLVDDGKLQLDVVALEPGKISAKARNSHTVKENKRINLPGTKFSMPFLADKDRNDIRFGCDMGIDFIAASFVNTPEDIKEIKAILKEKGAEHVKIFSKIESQYAVDHFDEIIAETDGVMVARGDLGLEIPYYEVPVAQKMMVRKCRAAGKPVIIATQMLDSMESNPSPTRAEVTDVYIATESGADATMLSGESAAGDFPVQSVEVMATINKRAEKEFYKKLYYTHQLEEAKKSSSGPRAEIASHVADKTIDGDYKFIVVLSRTGQLLSEIAKFRPNTNIIGVTNDQKQVTQFGITSSVFMSLDTSKFDAIKANKELAKEVVVAFGGSASDKILLVENDNITEL